MLKRKCLSYLSESFLCLDGKISRASLTVVGERSAQNVYKITKDSVRVAPTS